MPSLCDLTTQQKAKMWASHSLSTYELLDLVRDDPVSITTLPAHVIADMSKVVSAGWVEDKEGYVSITEAGLRFLRQ